MNTRSLILASGIAGLVMAFLSNLPVLSYGNCLACMWLWASGFLGVWIYQRNTGSTLSVTAGQGMVIGALSGLVGAVAGTIIGTFVGGAGLANILASQANNSSDVLGSAIGSFAVSGTFSILGLLFNAFIYPFFSAIGGAIGGVIFAKK